jgi:replication factor A1
MQNAQQQGQDRYRVLLSDGEHSHSGMLATQLSELIANGQIKQESLIQLTDYLCNQVQDKK